MVPVVDDEAALSPVEIAGERPKMGLWVGDGIGMGTGYDQYMVHMVHAKRIQGCIPS